MGADTWLGALSPDALEAVSSPDTKTEEDGVGGISLVMEMEFATEEGVETEEAVGATGVVESTETISVFK